MRKLTFWGALVGTVLGTRWVLGQRPAMRVPGQEGIPSPAVVDAYQKVTSLPHVQALYRWLARRALWKVPAAGVVLDIGCGPGHFIAELVKRGPRLTLVGLDASSEMLAVAADRYGDLGGRVAWQQGTVEALPFPDRYFDLVASTHSMHEWSDPLLALNEVARVLKPDGRFMIYDLRRDMAGFAWVTIWLAQRLVAPRALSSMDEPVGSVRAAHTPREIVELARKSQLQPWRVASGPFWVSLENAASP